MKQDCRQAIILAAGRGSRLGQATAEQPKCLQPLAGLALLDWNLRALSECGIEQVLVIGGWRAECIERFPVELRVHPRWAETQSVGSLLQAADWLQRAESLVMYGDGVYSPRVLRHVLGAADADILVPGDRDWLSLWRRRFENPLTDAESWSQDGNRLVEIGRRLTGYEQATAQFAGLLRLRPAGWEKLNMLLKQIKHDGGQVALDRLDMTALLDRALNASIAVHCCSISGGWLEVDASTDLVAYEQALAAGGFSHDFRPTEACPA